MRSGYFPYSPIVLMVSFCLCVTVHLLWRTKFEASSYFLQQLSFSVSTGSLKDPGILPRALDTVFKHISGRLYEQMDLRPYLNSDVQKLDLDQVRMEKSAKTALFSMLKEVSTQLSHSWITKYVYPLCLNLSVLTDF